MHEMFAWYIDNRYFITQEFVDSLIANKEEAVSCDEPLRNIIRKHMDDPTKGNPSSPITFLFFFNYSFKLIKRVL